MAERKPAEKRGGKRAGAGRPKNRKNNKTLAWEAHCREALLKAKPKSGDLTSLDFFRAVYRDDRLPFAIRSHAAEKALPFEHARLASTEFSGAGGGAVPVEIKVVRFSDQKA